MAKKRNKPAAKLKLNAAEALVAFLVFLMKRDQPITLGANNREMEAKELLEAFIKVNHLPSPRPNAPRAIMPLGYEALNNINQNTKSIAGDSETVATHVCVLLSHLDAREQNKAIAKVLKAVTAMRDRSHESAETESKKSIRALENVADERTELKNILHGNFTIA